ncbi:hypothetical protein HMPREF3217_01391 [Finegoldia magna]|nr:hypothetical protein HMPREF3217_01391 [Finegoldia magna]
MQKQQEICDFAHTIILLNQLKNVKLFKNFKINKYTSIVFIKIMIRNFIIRKLTCFIATNYWKILLLIVFMLFK